MKFQARASVNHDGRVKLKGRTMKCYSPNYLKKTYPNGGCKIVGELSDGKKEGAIGTLEAGRSLHSVSAVGHHNSFLWKTVGYFQVGEDEFVAILVSRLPLLLVPVVILVILLLLLFVGGSSGSPGVAPDRPLPSVDTNAEELEEDTSDQRPDVSGGGGSLSLSYTLEAEVNLSTGNIEIDFENPGKSTHNVALDMYIVSEGKEYLIARSDLLEAGYWLRSLTLLDSAPELSEGFYGGLYRISCYEPDTGAQVPIAPEITGLNITVVKE